MNKPLRYMHERRRVARFFIHLICLGMLFVLPEVIMGLGDHRHGPSPWIVYAKSMIFAGVFYVNYYVIIDRWADRPGRIWRLVGWNLAVIAVAVGLLYAVMTIGVWRDGHTPLPPHARSMAMRLSILLRDLVMVVLTVALSVSLKLSSRWHEFDRQRRELEAMGREEELRSLKSQLNPHFLFNSLNTVYALIAFDSGRAQRAVHLLSSMLRYVLDRDNASVRLDEELNFISNYVDMMKMRLGGRGTVNVNLDAGSDGDRMIAPLLFVSIVENVFKHGNTGSADDIFEISIVADGGVVRCHTVNRIADAPVAESSGIGLSNLSRRLHLLYGNGARLETSAEGNLYRTFMEINLK